MLIYEKYEYIWTKKDMHSVEAIILRVCYYSVMLYKVSEQSEWNSQTVT